MGFMYQWIPVRKPCRGSCTNGSRFGDPAGVYVPMDPGSETLPGFMYQWIPVWKPCRGLCTNGSRFGNPAGVYVPMDPGSETLPDNRNTKHKKKHEQIKQNTNGERQKRNQTNETE